MDDERVLFLRPALGGFGHHQQFSIPEDEDDVPAHRAHRFVHGTRHIKGTCRTQVLRSSCEWSLGLKETEKSIQTAYIAAILEAKHYVYIENQFFSKWKDPSRSGTEFDAKFSLVTSTEDDEDYVLKNQIGQAIVKRIIRAHEERENFKVFVLMPLMPAFPADLSTDDAATAR